MKLTRRALGKVATAAVLAPAAALPQTTATAPAQTTQAPENAQRNWLAEARESRTAAGRTVERVEVPMGVEPAFEFRA